MLFRVLVHHISAMGDNQVNFDSSQNMKLLLSHNSIWERRCYSFYNLVQWAEKKYEPTEIFLFFLTELIMEINLVFKPPLFLTKEWLMINANMIYDSWLHVLMYRTMHAILWESPFVDDLQESSCAIYINKGYQDFSLTMFWYIESFTWYKMCNV